MGKITAIITAAGSGKRMGGDRKKQYLELLDKPVLFYTLKNFCDCSCVDEIVLVLPEEDIVYVEENIVSRYGFEKVTSYVAGGRERQDSINNALNSLSFKADDVVIIHDGVRPFVSERMILDSVEGARKYGGAVAGVKVKDTIKEIEGGFYSKTLARDRLVAVQTPQTFRGSFIKEAYRFAYEEGFYSTDDAALMEKYSSGRVVYVEGGYFNIKITTREDLVFAAAILAAIPGGEV